MKPLFITAVILVYDPIHISHLNSILILCDCAGERMTLEVALKYWSCIWIKISSFGSKVPLCFVHAEKRQLRWISKSMIFSLFGSRLGLLHLRVVREAVLEDIMCLNFVEERSQKCDRENREGRWRQITSIYRLYLDLVVKKFYYINCLNTWATNCATFRNQMLCMLWYCLCT